MNKYSYGLVAAGALFAAGTFAMAVPAAAAQKPCCYNNGDYFNSTASTCRNNGGRVVEQQYCQADYPGPGYQGDNSHFSISLGNVVFGYSDGYYDNGRRWHDWRNDDERNWYRQNHGQTYYHMGRYDDRDQYRRGWLDGRRTDWRGDRGDVDFSVSLGNVVFGYSDGYYDNGRRWHRWRNRSERNWYRQNHRQSYYHMSRYRDRDRYRRDWLRGRRTDWRVGGDSGFSISLGNVVFGYSDGYYDNDRRWHNWRNDGERDWYRQHHGRTYYQMRRDGDNHRNRRDWREGRRDDWRDDGDRD